MSPSEITNGAANEKIVFRLTAEETDGALLEMDDFWHAPDHEVAAHTHPEIEETWTVMAGSVEFVIGSEEVFAGPGDVVVAPAGVRHSARNVGGPAHIRVQMRPAMRWQEFVTRYFELENDSDATEDGFVKLLAEFGPEIQI